MIKVTVNPRSEPKSYTFSQEIIVIGDGSPEVVNICFPSQGLHQAHVKIVKRQGESSEGEYWVINQANDPFVTYNGHPFGKRKVKEGDLIHIKDQEIKIEQITESKPVASDIPPTSIPKKESLMTYPDIEELSQDDHPEGWFPIDVEDLREKEKKPPVYKKDLPKAQQKKATPSRPKLKFTAFKLVAFLSLLFLSLTALITVEIYFRTQSKKEKEEMLAAESLADYAMALSYARVYHIVPQKHNWTDPQFLKNSLVDLLSTTSLPCGNIDSQGQFSNCSYILRFYTNADFSRYILIAQPSPSLSQWLIPKDSLIVDSAMMTIRKTSDLKSINRILSTSTPLDGNQGQELTAYIQKMPLLPLAKLSLNVGKKEFSPPRALGLVRPGAENLIYNAPRYYQFGGTLLKRMQSALSQPKNAHESAIFQSELDALSKMPHLVFYSDGGMQEALKNYRTLKTLIPNTRQHSFLIAYLLYSSSGNIVNSHLVLDTELPKIDELEEDTIALTFPPVKIEKYLDESFTKASLRKKGEEADQTFTPILHNLQTLLNDTLEKDRIYLPAAFFQLLAYYDEQKDKFKLDIKKTLDEIREKDPHVQEASIEKIMREFGLLDLYQSPPSLKERWEAWSQIMQITNKLVPPKSQT